MKPYEAVEVKDWIKAELFDDDFEYMGWQFDIPSEHEPNFTNHYAMCVGHKQEKNKIVFTAYHFKSDPEDRAANDFSVIESGFTIAEFVVRICPLIWEKQAQTNEHLTFAQTNPFLKLLYNFCFEHWQIQTQSEKA